MKRISPLLVAAVIIAACSAPRKEAEPVTAPATNSSDVMAKSFGSTKDGKEVNLYTLKNRNGIEMTVMNYGGIVVSLKVPDKTGKFDDVVLGYDSLASYEKASPYFGALIGRFGNRIAKASFTLDGQTYKLAANDGPNHLHGGIKGFDKVFWNVEPVGPASLLLSYRSADGEEGYPGNLDVEVLYTLTDSNEFKIDYKAVTDKKTVVNLTQHTYFNLGGHASGDILGHELELKADHFLPVDHTLIPTGVVAPVKNTPFDFTTSKSIGERINDKDQQLAFGKGYDHCWVLNNHSGELHPAGTLYHAASGRRMEVFTTEPAIQFYSGNFLDGQNIGKGGVAYAFRTGLCLETQHYPDSPNQSKFPSVVLSPGETYQTTTIYRFSVAK